MAEHAERMLIVPGSADFLALEGNERVGHHFLEVVVRRGCRKQTTLARDVLRGRLGL
jgi:hypothetical protein